MEKRNNGNGSERVARMAYSLWLERGCPQGDDLRDWFEAEKRLSSVSEASKGDGS